MEAKKINLRISGKDLQATEGDTIVRALWAAGMAKEIQTGCVGGVCGACTVTIRFPDDRSGGTELACLRTVEEGMEVFPYVIEPDTTVPPENEPTLGKLRSSFPTLDRCSKCGSCTTACPMNIPVMDSILRMQQESFQAVSEDFTTCIHCGLCRFVCEDMVKPHNMGLWIRRSLGMSEHYPFLEDAVSASNKDENQEWRFLLNGSKEDLLKHAKAYRREGKIPG